MNVQHTYRIKHKGVESTPHSLADLRQMWQTGQIDHSTEFKRGDSTVWLEANDLWTELQLDNLPSAANADTAGLAAHPSSTKPGATGNLKPIAPTHVRVTSVRIPFKEVLVLVLKFYLATLLLSLAAVTAWFALARYMP